MALKTSRRSSARSALITLTTDFGLEGAFVGMMKGAIARIHPLAAVVDLTHGIAPQDIRGAARTIAQGHGYFPPGSIHIVVVDPGVGSGRRRLIVSAGGHLFVGPDSGVFSLIYLAYPGRACPGARVFEVTAREVFLPSPGRTFEGRDVFAPVAAWLARGRPAESLGAEISDPVHLDFPLPAPVPRGIRGEVVEIDRFGNAVTNISAADIRTLGEAATLTVRFKGRTASMTGYYAEGGDGEPHALINSAGFVEIYLFMENAAKEYSLDPGSSVSVLTSRPK